MELEDEVNYIWLFKDIKIIFEIQQGFYRAICPSFFALAAGL